MKIATILIPALLAAQSAGDEGRVRLCLGATADYDPVLETVEIPDTVNEFCAVFDLGDRSGVGKLTAVYTAVDVGDVAPPNYRLTQVEQPVAGMKRGRFRYSQTNPLPVGRYRLEVLADDRAWKSIDFRVV